MVYIPSKVVGGGFTAGLAGLPEHICARDIRDRAERAIQSAARATDHDARAFLASRFGYAFALEVTEALRETGCPERAVDAAIRIWRNAQTDPGHRTAFGVPANAALLDAFIFAAAQNEQMEGAT